MGRSTSKSQGGHRLVYSTEQGPVSRPGRSRKGAPSAAQVPSDGIVRVGRQTKGRKGKGVTLVTGLTLPPAELKKLAGELKKRCGSGGAVKDGVIEIQGDHRDPVVEMLQGRGWTVKKAGG